MPCGTIPAGLEPAGPGLVASVMRFRRILAALEGAGLRYVVVGSMAAKLNGAECAPRDLDLVVDPADGEAIVRILAEQGFHASLPLGLNDVSVLRFFDEAGLETDLFARFAIPFETLVANSRLVEDGHGPVRVASAADLRLARARTGR
jgi:hypothetical protein